MKIAIVLLALAIGAALAAPTARRFAIERRSAALAEDLRRFTAAFQEYAHERSNWPPGAAAPGEIPPGMEQKLAGGNWQRPSPVGGGYRWARHTAQRGERFEAAILIVPVPGNGVSEDRRQFTDLDRRLDDGDLNTGKFRLGFRNLPVWVLEH